MKFDLTKSFEDNLVLFKADVEKIDAECAKILLDNILTLCREGDAAGDRSAIAEFHHAVLQALDNLSEPPEAAKT